MDRLVGVGTGLYAQRTQPAHPSMPVLGRQGSRETLELPLCPGLAPHSARCLFAHSSGQAQRQHLERKVAQK